jgi:hypothetical protein
MKPWPAKDPEEVLDYGFDWSKRQIGEDVIVQSTAQVIEGDVVVNEHGPGPVLDCPHGQGTVTWLSGGTAGTTCLIRLHMITTSARQLEETLKIKIKER